MSIHREIIERSLAILYCVADKDGVIIFQNKAFFRAYTHLRPSLINQIGDGVPMVTNIAVKNPDDIHTAFISCKDSEGGTMLVAYEVFYKDNHFHFVGSLQVDVEQADEAALAALRKVRKDAVFHLSHNVRAPLAKVIGLNDLLKGVNGDCQASELIEMIGNASRELDEAVKALGEILNIDL